MAIGGRVYDAYIFTLLNYLARGGLSGRSCRMYAASTVWVSLGESTRRSMIASHLPIMSSEEW